MRALAARIRASRSHRKRASLCGTPKLLKASVKVKAMSPPVRLGFTDVHAPGGYDTAAATVRHSSYY